MKDPELEFLINGLESREALSVADFEGVLNALQYLLPEEATRGVTPQSVGTTDGAMLVADAAYPNWVVHIRGRANDRDGHWRCALRESDSRDNDKAFGSGASPVLAQAILVAILKLSMMLKKDDA